MANSIDPDQTAPREQFDLDLHCLIWYVCPNIVCEYGTQTICSHNICVCKLTVKYFLLATFTTFTEYINLMTFLFPCLQICSHAYNSVYMLTVVQTNKQNKELP